MAQAIHVNVLSPEFHNNPMPFLRELRHKEPVYWSEETNHWVITRYDDVKTALTDYTRFSNQGHTNFVVKPEFFEHLTPLLTMFSKWAVFQDPPEHARLRGLINRAFRRETIKGIHHRSHSIANWLIDQVYEDGEMDFMSDFAFALPATIIAEIMGMDRSDLPLVKRWSVNMAHAAGRTDNFDVMMRGQESLIEMTAFLKDRIAEREKNPREDFITFLIKAWKEDDRLSFDEVVAQTMLLLAGGHVTTQNTIGGGLLALFKNPDQLAMLRDDLSLSKNAAEELYRFTSPAQCPTRVAACDFEFGGRQISRGEGIMPMVVSANHDEQVFENPDVIDITRDCRKHLAFGMGHHLCPGKFLAMEEIPVAYEVLLTRIPDIRWNADTEDWNQNLSFRGPSSLPVAWG